MSEHADDGFTLEKLKIDDRLRSLELQTARLVSHLESEAGTWARIQSGVDSNFQRMAIIIERHDKLLFGDGNPGILTKLDRQEQIEDGRKWQFRVIWATIVTMALKTLYDLFAKYK